MVERTVKEEVLKLGESLKNSFLEGATGYNLNLVRTRTIDNLISRLCETSPFFHPSEVCVVALGGYGRRELSLYSDIDLLLLHKDSYSGDIAKLVDNILYPLWNAGLDVSGVTRSLDECRQMFKGDIRAQTSMLDARLLIGNVEIFDGLKALIDVMRRDRTWRRSFIRKKIEEHEARLKKFGSSVYLGEPHVKEGEGGLREYHTALWIAHVLEGENRHEAVNYKLWEEPLEFLWRVRFGLHMLNNLREDCLRYEMQKELAEKMGYFDETGRPSNSLLMQRYYYHAAKMRNIHRQIIDELTGRRKVWHRILNPVRRTYYGRGVEAVGNRISFTNKSGREDPFAAIAHLWDCVQRYGVYLDENTKAYFRNAPETLKEKAVHNDILKEAFLKIFERHKNIAHVLREMHDCHYLDWIIPEYSHLYYQVQENAYHIYTVDEHSLKATEEIEKLVSGHYQKDFPIYYKAVREIERKDLMFLTVFLHDVGKGKSGYHPHTGAEIVRKMCPRFNMDQKDIDTIAFLIESHLITAQLAFFRDISDPHILEHFANSVGTVEKLDMLLVLAFADIRSIGPDVWTHWKNRLLLELYSRTRDVLIKGGFSTRDIETKIAAKKMEVRSRLKNSSALRLVDEWLSGMPAKYLLSTSEEDIAEDIKMFEMREELPCVVRVHHRPEEGVSALKIVTRDSPGLFTKIAAVMAANNLNILDAQLNTGTHGYVSDTILVAIEKGQAAIDEDKWNLVLSQLRGLTTTPMDLIPLIERRKSSPLMKTIAKKPEFTIEVNNDVSAYYTVVDVATEDRVGLLYDISSALFKSGCTIDMARATTHAGHVVDVFYIKDKNGNKIVSQDAVENIKRNLSEALGNGFVATQVKSSSSF